MDAWKSRRQGSTACQDWAVFIVSSQKENEASTKIKNKIAKTEYFFQYIPQPQNPPLPPSVPPSRRPGKLFGRTPHFPPSSERSYNGLLSPRPQEGHTPIVSLV